MQSDRLIGLDPMLNENTVLLILGTFPGDESLLKQQYYADANNDFWKILQAALNEQLTGSSYEAKVRALLERGIGLWDVYHSCVRDDSKDRGISDEELNDFTSLKTLAANLRLVIFNGKRAGGSADELLRHFGYMTRVCPSSSGANRGNQEERTRCWRENITLVSQKEITMTDFQNINFEKKNQIAYITIDRPKVLNALNMATMQELKDAFASIKDDAEVRVAILTGAGEKAFVAGADIGELAQQTPVSAKEYTHRGQAIVDAIENLGKPVIACVNGFALGGGCELAMACTMRLASDNAKLGQPEVKLGLIPGYGGTQRLSRLVGKGLAMQQILTGDMITAQEAYRIGLVNEVVPQTELIARAEAIAAKIIANAPLAIRYAMEAVNRGFDLTLADGLFLEATLFAVCCATEDKNEGTRAFLEKRPAQFKGK